MITLRGDVVVLVACPSNTSLPPVLLVGALEVRLCLLLLLLLKLLHGLSDANLQWVRNITPAALAWRAPSLLFAFLGVGHLEDGTCRRIIRELLHRLRLEIVSESRHFFCLQRLSRVSSHAAAVVGLRGSALLNGFCRRHRLTLPLVRIIGSRRDTFSQSFEVFKADLDGLHVFKELLK